MVNYLNNKSLQFGAAMIVGAMTASNPAQADSGGGRDFSTIAENIIVSIESVPGLITGLAYMIGILLGVLGILKIKDHVEQPTQVKLQDGAIRIAAGGALFALPIIYEAMLTTIGDQSGAPSAAELNKVDFAVN